MSDFGTATKKTKEGVTYRKKWDTPKGQRLCGTLVRRLVC